MTARPTRVVDAHVHLWDPARTDWYPYLSGPHTLDMGGDSSAMARRFDVATYRDETAGWNVEKLVNVAAATGVHSVDETLALDAAAATDGGPDAIVGGLPPTDTVAEAVDLLERQQQAARFRGVRPMGSRGGPLPPTEVLAELAARDLLFELMAHPDQLLEAADGLGEVDGLAVVVEHTGWPRSSSGDERALWRTGMAALAELGDRVTCKVSGLAMPLGAVTVDAFAPWVEGAIELFGVERCLFASNFPVDAAHDSFDELYSTFAALTESLGPDAQERLFATNAERIYRC